jgi:hypothetical protein
MTFSMAVYGQALDNESPDPAKADGVWLEDPHNAASQAVVAFVMHVKATGRVVVSTRDLVVTQAPVDGLIVEARCCQSDSGGRDSYLVYCEPGASANPPALHRSELALIQFATELGRNLVGSNFSEASKQGESKFYRHLKISSVIICAIFLRSRYHSFETISDY